VGICPNALGSKDIDRAEETISRYDKQTDRKNTGGSQTDKAPTDKRGIFMYS
jgi:hypothetical protein